uniref:hypothetical protein n=1 Tax=Orrella sp. TaxID=1921583 RepID=UPI004048B9C9
LHSSQQKPLVNIQPAQVVSIQPAPTYCYVSELVLLGFADASFEAFNPNSRNMTMRILQY